MSLFYVQTVYKYMLAVLYVCLSMENVKLHHGSNLECSADHCVGSHPHCSMMHGQHWSIMETGTKVGFCVFQKAGLI